MLRTPRWSITEIHPSAGEERTREVGAWVSVTAATAAATAAAVTCASFSSSSPSPNYCKCQAPPHLPAVAPAIEKKMEGEEKKNSPFIIAPAPSSGPDVIHSSLAPPSLTTAGQSLCPITSRCCSLRALVPAGRCRTSISEFPLFTTNKGTECSSTATY